MTKMEGGRFSGVIHSVFRQAVNILAADGCLYSLVADKLDNAPNTLRILLPAHEFITDMDVESGIHVFMDSGILIVGGMSIETADARLWKGNLPAFPTYMEMTTLEQNLGALCHSIRLYGQAGGVKGLVDEADAAAGKDVFGRLLKERGENLLGALAARKFSLAYSAGRSLLGLGGGQTPSGDDFCAGLLAVINMPMGPFGEEFRCFGRYLAAQAQQLTTGISQALLAQAAEGRVREKIINLLCEVIQGSQGSTMKAAMQVLQIGSMSGTDLAVGVAAGLRLGIYLRKGRDIGEENYGDKNQHQEKCLL